MAHTEVLVRRPAAPGAQAQVAMVVGTRRSSAKTVSVRWSDGREERTTIDPHQDQFAVQGSLHHDWLMDPALLRKRFDHDPHGVFLDIIKEAGAAVSTVRIKAILTGLGVAKSAVDKAWTASQAKFKRHEHVIAKGSSYSWTESPRDPYEDIRAMRPATALDRLLKGKVPKDEKPVLVEAIRKGLTGSGDSEVRGSRDEMVRAAELRAAQDHKIRAQGIQAYAALAIELEELVANGATPDIVVERIHNRASAQGLTVIGTAGETTSFDRRRHTPIGGAFRDGAQVIVVRPGYSWRTANDDVLVAKAMVVDQ